MQLKTVLINTLALIATLVKTLKWPIHIINQLLISN